MRANSMIVAIVVMATGVMICLTASKCMKIHANKTTGKTVTVVVHRPAYNAFGLDLPGSTTTTTTEYK